MDEPARVLVADPAWLFDDSLPGGGRGASKHYRCLTLPELMRFPLPPLADDCLLVLWRVGGKQLDALKVAEAWGFGQPYGDLVWVKTKCGHVPTKSVRMGMGRMQRNAHEIAITCKRGKPKRAAADVLSVFFAPRGRHSEKPDRFYEVVESLMPGPYHELFARRTRPGWRCEGDECDATS